MANIELVPKPATIKEIVDESRDVKSFVLECVESEPMNARPGQFIEISVQGYGEATFAVTRTAQEGKEFTISVKRIEHIQGLFFR